MKHDIHSAAACGDMESLDRLLDEGVSVATLNAEGLSALHLATYRKHIDAMRMLLKRSADVERGGPHNYTPLMVASRCGWGDAIQLLLDYGANVNAMNTSGATPLIFAASYCPHTYILDLLIHGGADIELSGGLALLGAALNGHIDNTARLVRAGADTNFKNKLGKTALDYALEKQHKGVIVVLESAGVQRTNANSS